MKKVTLVFLLRENQVLLAMKKRGTGEGKWNGVGGKIEQDETPEAAAIRECSEEIGVVPKNLRQVAEIEFSIPSQDFHNYAYVYSTNEWTGKIVETEEMAPRWFDQDKVPYDSMWSDDQLWLPQILSGQSIKARFVFDEDEQVSSSEVEEHHWS